MKIDSSFKKLEKMSYNNSIFSGHWSEDDMNSYIESGKDIDVKNRDGLTLLGLAILYDYRRIVKLLLYKRCKVDSVDNIGTTAVCLAIDYERLEIIKLLLENNPSSIDVIALLKVGILGIPTSVKHNIVLVVDAAYRRCKIVHQEDGFCFRAVQKYN